MLYYMNIPSIVQQDCSYLLKHTPMMIDTDDFVAEYCTDDDLEMLVQKGIPYLRDSLHDYIKAMTSPFVSKDLAFSISIAESEFDIWYKGYYYKVQDLQDTIVVNDLKYGMVYAWQNGLLFSETASFIGIVDGHLKVLVVDNIVLDIYEGYVVLHNTVHEIGSSYTSNGIKMSKEAFLRKLFNRGYKDAYKVSNSL